MSASKGLSLFNGELTASGPGAVANVPARSKSFFAELQVSAKDAATVLDMVIEQSSDGQVWYPLATFAQQPGGTATNELIAISGGCLPIVRANATLAGGAPSATVQCALHFDDKS